MFEENLITTRLIGPQEPPRDQSTSRPSPKIDQGKAKMPEYGDDEFDDNKSTHSLDSEFCGFNVPIIRSPIVKKALTSANEKLCLSTHEKNLVSQFGYNDYMAYHYAFMMKVATVREPENFPKQPRIHERLKQ